MKSIEITGKRNIEGMSKIKNPQRKSVTSWNIDVSYFTYLKQIQLINSFSRASYRKTHGKQVELFLLS